MTPQELRARIYAGLLGKAVGVRLGAPVEPHIWDYHRIRAVYGEVDGYLRDYRNFAADDDTNGPLVFARALWDEGDGLTHDAAGRNWLDYIGDGHGMLWWGGYDISTEETAFRHLQNGIMPPASGSIALRGQVAAEQIGGQIFSDCWGWVCPGDPAEAARLARIMASVAHDGEALQGAAYVAAATAAAFVAPDIATVHRMARAEVGEGSHYARVIDAVAAFHAANPTDWRGCFVLLERDFGYDKWPGVCHVIPNAGVVVLALLYGAGDMPRTAAIATMCGWDTDCNAGNAAAIAGVLQGVQPHWARWRRPINDTLTLSAVTGALNICDIPSAARDFAVLALRRKGAAVPEGWAEAAEARAVAFDFALPGSSHGLRAEGSHRLRAMPGLTPGALDIQIDRWTAGDNGRVFWKPFYRRDEFDDDRYRPMLSPVAASGQRVQIAFAASPPAEGVHAVHYAPYVRLASSGRIIPLAAPALLPLDRVEIGFTLPETDEAIDEIGLLLDQRDAARVLIWLRVYGFAVSGPGHTGIDPALERAEWGGVSRFSFNRGRWTVAGGVITGTSATDADLWTGHSFARDQIVTATITRTEGASHLITARVRGNCRYYAAGIEGGQAVLRAENFGTTTLATAPLPNVPERVTLSLSSIGNRLVFSIDGHEVLAATDATHPMGMAGLRMAAPGTLVCHRFEIRES